LGAKFPPEALRASGLFYYRDGETDHRAGSLRFGSRLTIPIRDIQGRIVGFSARFIDGLSRPNAFADAKYINSPETEIFHKGSLLFGLDRARQHIDGDGAFWLVEGQFDAMRCWDRGILTAVAPQGTAITDTQLATLRRYTTRVHCMLDGDRAGSKAAERMLPMAMAAGLDVDFFPLPEGSDPDSYLREDFTERFQSLEKSALTAMEFLVGRHFGDGKNLSGQAKAEALSRIYEVISMADSSVARESYLDELAAITGLDHRAIVQDFKTFTTRRRFIGAPSVPPGGAAPKGSEKLSSAEGQLLAVVLADGDVAAKVAALLDEELFQNPTSEEGRVLVKVLNEVREGMGDGIRTLDRPGIFSDGEKNIAYALLADLDDGCDPVAVANACLRKMHGNFIRDAIGKINGKFREISLDESDMVRTLLQRRLGLRKLLKSPPLIRSAVEVESENF
jgi:DNA primase